MRLLVLNTGSSTVKFSLLESDTEQLVFEGIADWLARPARLQINRPGAPAQSLPLPVDNLGAAVTAILEHLARAQPPLLSGAFEVAAVGHRVVHGGESYTAGVRITPEVKTRLAQLDELAPLHNPINLEGIEAAQAAWPHVPHVAVFDTAFHATLPPAAKTYAIPHAWIDQWRLRRYGFHGLSHAYCASRAAQMLGAQDRRLVICHLGNGASLSAVRAGVCVDTTMGFTPLEGLVMGTRSGSIDPGLLIYVLRHKGLSADDLDRVLNRESGVQGVSGISSDMRQVLAAAHDGNPRAQLALDVYIHRLRQLIAAMAASLGGLDALVFTAGVGEHSAPVRALTCQGLGFLGVRIDEAANNAARPDTDISAPSSAVRALVIATREDLTIVRETVRVLRSERPP